MNEASSGPRWELTVWFGGRDDHTTFAFDAQPTDDSTEKVVSFSGDRQGRPVWVNVSIERVSAWSLKELPR